METVNIFLAYSHTAQILSIFYSMLKPFEVMIVELSPYFCKSDFSQAEFYNQVEFDFDKNELILNKGSKSEYKTELGDAYFDIDCKNNECINNIQNKKLEGLNDLYCNVRNINIIFQCYHSLAVILYMKINCNDHIQNYINQYLSLLE